MLRPSGATSGRPGPTPGGERIEALDTLRGFAVLGILVMNITGMAFPFAAYFDPMAYGGAGGLDYGAWVFAHVLFDQKMMGIFSILFGAGVILLTGRAERAGGSPGALYLRRMAWLLLIGLAHAYLVWHGDILVTYALCGLVLILLRRRSARFLIVSGVVVLAFGALLLVGGGYGLGRLRDVAAEIESKVAAGAEMTPRRQALVDQWNAVRHTFAPTPEEIQQTVATMRGRPGDVLRANVRETAGMHAQAVPFVLFWRALALMLLGMGLMKAGVLTANAPARLYGKLMAWGIGLGIPVIALGVWQWSRHDYDFVSRWLMDGHYNHFASVLVSLAYVGLVMRACQTGALPWLRKRLAAVGQMALTNYLLQSLLGVLLFYGYGLALFGQVSRFHLWWFVLGIWALQLAYSPWWLRRYRFGPAEWLWRCLTYWRRQPLRIAP